MCKPRKYFSANQKQLEPTLLQLLFEPDQSGMVYQLTVINVLYGVLGNLYRG